MQALTIGTFDIPHIGHAKLFKRMEALGRVIVGVNSDQFVLKYKGEYPVFATDERLNLISGMGYETHINHDAGASLIRQINPDYLVIGSDWAEKEYYRQIGISQAELDRLNITLVYVPYTNGISTSEIKERIHD